MAHTTRTGYQPRHAAPARIRAYLQRPPEEPRGDAPPPGLLERVAEGLRTLDDPKPRASRFAHRQREGLAALRALAHQRKAAP